MSFDARRSRRPIRLGVLLAAILLLGSYAPVAVASAGGPCGAWLVDNSVDAGPGSNTLYSVDARSMTDVWAVGRGMGRDGQFKTLAERYNGTGWSVVSTASPAVGDHYLTGVDALSASDAIAVGYTFDQTGDEEGISHTLIERYNGTRFRVVSSPNVGASHNYLRSVSASQGEAWAVGGSYNTTSGWWETLAVRMSGATWSVLPTPNSASGYNYLEGVATLGPLDAWAVGWAWNATSERYETLILHWTGSSWSRVPSPNVGPGTNQLFGISAVTDDDIWAVGRRYLSSNISRTLTLHYDGTFWSAIPSANRGVDHNLLSSVSATSPIAAWAVGTRLAGSVARTLIEYWNGSQWTVVNSPNRGQGDNRLFGVSAVTYYQAFAVGHADNAGGTPRTLVTSIC